MADRMYICGYKHCLYPNEKVASSDSVIICKRHYHTDCAELRMKIKESVSLYMEFVEDKSQFPAATSIINNLVFKSGVPIDYVIKQVKRSQRYYANKPVMALYGIRKMFYEKEFKA